MSCFLAQVSSILPESFLTGGILRVRDLVDRRVGNSIGIKRMMGLGRTGYPEKIPTHVYISFQHFFELNELLNDLMRSETENPGIQQKNGISLYSATGNEICTNEKLFIYVHILWINPVIGVSVTFMTSMIRQYGGSNLEPINS